MRSTRIENTRPTVPFSNTFRLVCVSYDRFNSVADRGFALGCAHMGGKSTYAILSIFPTVARLTLSPHVAYA
jgi:hypothetical protein